MENIHPAATKMAERLAELPPEEWSLFIDDSLRDAFVSVQLSLLEYLLQSGDADAIVERARRCILSMKEELAAKEASTKTLEERLDEARAELNGARLLARHGRQHQAKPEAKEQSGAWSPETLPNHYEDNF